MVHSHLGFGITDDFYVQGYLHSKAIPFEELKNFKI